MNDLFIAARDLAAACQNLLEGDHMGANEDGQTICPHCGEAWEKDFKDGRELETESIEHRTDCATYQAARALHEWRRACGL